MTRNSQGETWNIVPSLTYLGHILSLEGGEQSLYKVLRDSTKRNIKKAKAEGVEVMISDQPESIKQFYILNSVTRKRHGLPTQPLSFFRNVLELVIRRGYGILVLGLYEGKAIAASVFFHFGKKAVYKYGASDLEYQSLRANNLVMWEAIKWYFQNGYKSLCFGRTEPENQGLIQFKSGWGATGHQINYYRYDLKKSSFVSDSSRVSGFHNKIFKNTPTPILNTVGRLLYRHFA
jgi:lipid II:glycine glycyltransferase (peptidoglycan interpeptide bridge formation enzyme)